MPALLHLRLICTSEEHSESAAAWEALLEAAAANQQLQRLDIMISRGAALNMSDVMCGILLRLQRTHLTIACDPGDSMDDCDA